MGARARASEDERPRRDPQRSIAEHAFSRAAGAPLVPGNAVRLLRDAAENYPAWLAALAGARSSILFEQYILADDEVGRQFAAVLAERASAGVRVRMLYDWLGAMGERTRHALGPLAAAGGEVRCFNPPRVDSPLGWLHRNHRKCIVVDGEIGFVTGLCIANRWAGDAQRGIAPWRDTGVEVRGPAVADLARAFAQTWAEAGAPIPDEELPAQDRVAAVGQVPVRVVATAPSTTGVYRLDHLIAALARRTLWLTDAYFVGTASYVQALRAAAMDGVDVRFLVPGESDLALIRPLTRVGYRPLLEAGVRVFEWNGPMLHAKSAVADRRWARVGSSNLNVSSWMGNHELDVAVEHEGFAVEMEEAYLADLERSTEVILGTRRPRRPRARGNHPPTTRGERRISTGIAAAGALRIGHTVGAALGGYRLLGPAEARLLLLAGIALLAASALALAFPRLAAFPAGLLGLWLSAALLVKAFKLRRAATRRGTAEAVDPGPRPDAPRTPSEGGGTEAP